MTTTDASGAVTPAPVTAVAASTHVKRKKARLRIRRARRDVMVGKPVTVSGTLLPAKAGRTVSLQVRRGSRWVTLDRAHTRHGGAFKLVYKTRQTGTTTMRIAFKGDNRVKPGRRFVGHVNVYRRAMASWYALYGGALACGGRLSYNTQGVANKTLPCGTKVTLRYRGRTVRVPVIDRGPYVAGREYDLTGATKRALGFGDTGYVMATR